MSGLWRGVYVFMPKDDGPKEADDDDVNDDIEERREGESLSMTGSEEEPCPKLISIKDGKDEIALLVWIHR